ncbi:thermonuclease family protein [Bradyrhizobium sp. USDA 3315]
MRWAFALLWLAVSLPSYAFELRAIPQIVDADTVRLGTIKVQLQGIDAPEIDQICTDAGGKTRDCGVEARETLKRYAGSKTWVCRLSGTDRYHRELGTCSVDGEDISSWLVRNGWALAFRRYPVAYVEFAKRKQLGLWSGAFVAPWDWRHRSSNTTILGAKAVPIDAQRVLTGPRLTEAPLPTCAIKANFRSIPTCIYHMPGGRFYDRLGMNDTASRRWFCSEADAQAAGCRRSKL